MQRQRDCRGSPEFGDRAAQQFTLDVEQRHPPAVGENPVCLSHKPDATRCAGDESNFLRAVGRVPVCERKGFPLL